MSCFEALGCACRCLPVTGHFYFMKSHRPLEECTEANGFYLHVRAFFQARKPIFDMVVKARLA